MGKVGGHAQISAQQFFEWGAEAMRAKIAERLSLAGYKNEILKMPLPNFTIPNQVRLVDK